MKFTDPTYLVFAKLDGELSFPEYPLYKNIATLEDARAMAAEAVTKGCYKSAMVVGTLAVFHGEQVAMEEIGAPYQPYGGPVGIVETPVGFLDKEKSYPASLDVGTIVQDHPDD